MMTFETVNLLALQPPSLRKDPVTAALCKAVQPEVNVLSQALQSLMIYTGIDSQPEEVLDELAKQWHIDWYDPEDSLEAKRKNIKVSLAVHRSKGTAYAIEQAVKASFGSAWVEEWFDYGGQPYHFRIFVSNPDVTAGKAVQFERMVEDIKNVRSYLEAIILLDMAGGSFFLGGAIYDSETVRCKQSGKF